MTVYDVCVIFIPIFCIVALICILEYCKAKQAKKWNKFISDAKEQLADAGLVFNHSYELRHDDKIRFLRIFELKYNPESKKIYAHVYMTTKSGEIGTWYDDYTYLLDIHERWNLTDTGEWDPDN